MARPNIGSETEYLPGFEPVEAIEQTVVFEDLLPRKGADGYSKSTGHLNVIHRTGPVQPRHPHGMGSNARLTAPDD